MTTSARETPASSTNRAQAPEVTAAAGAILTSQDKGCDLFDALEYSALKACINNRATSAEASREYQARMRAQELRFRANEQLDICEEACHGLH